MYAALAPQLAAAMTFERGGADVNAMSSASVDAAETSDVEEAQASPKTVDKTKKKKKSLIPSLRNLIGEKGAVAAMLKSILSFLEMRFPALAFLTGANVLMSLSVFSKSGPDMKPIPWVYPVHPLTKVQVLLFVFYYCHKRGKETRLKRLAEGASTATTSDSPTLRIGPSLQDLESNAFFDKEDRERAEKAAEATVVAGAREGEREVEVEAEQAVREAKEVPLPVGKGESESESDEKVKALLEEAEGQEIGGGE